MTDASAFKIHLLDVGSQEYGDALLCEFDKKTILIDGAHPENINDALGHPSLATQLSAILGQPTDKLHVDLIIVTHAHSDHIGCLPALVDRGLSAEWALVADEKLGWGHVNGEATFAPRPSTTADILIAALREEPLNLNSTPSQLSEFLEVAASLESRYVEMVNRLQDKMGDHLVRYVGQEDPKLSKIVSAFQDVGMRILGPTEAHLQACAKHLKKRTAQYLAECEQKLSEILKRPTITDIINEYVLLRRSEGSTPESSKNSLNAFVNLQSLVVQMSFANWKMLFTGDMQLADPGVTDETILSSVDTICSEISKASPYDFIKLAHHGSKNGTDKDILASGTPSHAVVGICSGSTADVNHPDPHVLDLLKQDNFHWVRTDRNGQSTVTITDGKASIQVVHPPLDNGQAN